jgi:hypothetical protein
VELAIVEKIFCKVLPLFLFISVFFSIFAHHIENHSIFLRSLLPDRKQKTADDGSIR